MDSAGAVAAINRKGVKIKLKIHTSKTRDKFDHPHRSHFRTIKRSFFPLHGGLFRAGAH